tara:strand:+ start:647 stop:880 length:234 start_codon:yes stop_codon:yes gene_type:complete
MYKKRMVMSVDLESSVKNQGKWVTKIIHFIEGEKRTIEGVNTHTIRQGQFTKFHLKDGSYLMVNDKNVLMIEVFKEE